MTAKEIIIKLIDEKAINGEEAYILLNAVLQSEMMEAWKVLDASKRSSKSGGIDLSPYAGPYSTNTGVTGITWTGGPTSATTLTCSSGELGISADLLTSK